MNHISNTPININELLKHNENDEAGGIVLFSGTVRLHNNGKEVSHLEYEAHTSMANKMISNLLAEAKEKWKLESVCCVHRVGKLAIGDCAVAVITASAHRDEAYQANRYIIEQVKHTVPIWKKEVYADGSYEWGNNCNCGDPHHKH